MKYTPQYSTKYRRPPVPTTSESELVERIDPELICLQRLSTPADAERGNYTFLVRNQSGTPRILKCEYKLPILSDSDSEARLPLEARALRRLSGVPGITKLVKSYNLPDYFAILKQYVPGSQIQKENLGTSFILKNLLLKMHNCGIYIPEIMMRDIIYSEKKCDFFIVNVRNPIIVTDFSPLQKNALQLKADDMRSIEAICRGRR